MNLKSYDFDNTKIKIKFDIRCSELLKHNITRGLHLFIKTNVIVPNSNERETIRKYNI